MKKLLLILLCFPMIGFGQDVPLTEKTITTEKMLRKNLRKQNKSLAMRPRNQLGYITNFDAHPRGGINYFNHFSNFMGIYIDWRPSGNSFHKYNYTSKDVSYLNEYTTFNETLWTSVINLGLSCRVSHYQHYAIMIYSGIGRASTKTFSGFPQGPSTPNGFYWVEDGRLIIKTNFNFGILIQTNGLFSYQIGYDSTIKGVNLGMGFTWN